MLWQVLGFDVACCSRSDDSEGSFCLAFFNEVERILCVQHVISGFNLVFGSSQFVFFFVEIVQALQGVTFC